MDYLCPKGGVSDPSGGPRWTRTTYLRVNAARTTYRRIRAIERRDVALSVANSKRARPVASVIQRRRGKPHWLPCVTVPPPSAILRDQTDIRRRSGQRRARFREMRLRSCGYDCGE